MRYCPKCQTLREMHELFCEGENNACNFPLTDQPIVAAGWVPSAEPRPAPTTVRQCANGHELDAGDLICPTCQAAPADTLVTPTVAAPPDDPSTTGLASDVPNTPATPDASPREIDGWQLGRKFGTTSRVRESFTVTHAADGRTGVLTFYAAGSEPDPAVYDVLRMLPRDHVPEIIATGRWEGRAYEVSEELAAGSLADVGLLPNDLPTLSRIVDEIGRALHNFAEHGLRHRDLHPGAILLRSRVPLDLVVTAFGSARLSDFDLDIVSPLEVTRYSAPEAVVGGVAAASDWWSLGMILLEQVTRGECFDGINDQAFLIHVLTNGAPIADDVDPRIGLLLRGLLARDRRERWSWNEVSRWLAGEDLEAPASAFSTTADLATGPTIVLGGQSFTRAPTFALAAAASANWEEAKQRFLRGEVTTWAEAAECASPVVAGLRQVARLVDVAEDFRLALALRHLNPSMPLIWRGEIVTPGWLLEHPDEGYELITGPVPDQLAHWGTEQWLTQLKTRAAAIRTRARQYDIALNEEELRINLLATSRTRLAALWDVRRRLMPEAAHPALQAILDRSHITEEDLILLLSADVGQFQTAESILAEAGLVAQREGVAAFEPTIAAEQLLRSRRELFAMLDDRVSGFARCGSGRVDEWVDQYRLDRRLAIARLLVVLAVPLAQWAQPPGQAQVEALLRFFAAKVTAAVQRGPLTRMTIGKTTPRADLMSLDNATTRAEELLRHVLSRNDQMIPLDRGALQRDPQLESRLRSLHSHTMLYRRDSGIDGLYLGFPFLLIADATGRTTPRVAPVLLWPVKLRPEVGAAGRISIGFDRDREEVRLNPAFDGLLGPEETKRWRDAADSVLRGDGVSAAAVMDILGTLATPRGRALEALPGRELRLTANTMQLCCSAVLFHLTYVGQAVSEDLRLLQKIPPGDTGLATALRLTEAPRRATSAVVAEHERYFPAPSDPSQEEAVFLARTTAGLVVEGPPGTGKSQTIVNLVSDAIGQGRSVLIVCQKQAALDVVRKRLEAEGLANRLVQIQDVNRDRQPVIRAVREQVEEQFRIGSAGLATLRRDRTNQAAQIESLNSTLNGHHEALQRPDSATGTSYRGLLGELVVLRDTIPAPIDAPDLRALLGDLDPSALTQLKEECGPLARLWLPAHFENSPLNDLEQFSADSSTLSAFDGDYWSFLQAETQRLEVLGRTPAATAVAAPEEFRLWADANVAAFRNLSTEERQRLSQWCPLFQGARDQTQGDMLLAELRSIITGLEKLEERENEDSIRSLLMTLDDATLANAVNGTTYLLVPATIFSWLSPARWLRRAEMNRFCKSHELPPERSTWARLATSGKQEQAVRPWRTKLGSVSSSLGGKREAPARMKRVALSHMASTLATQLGAVRDLVARRNECSEAPLLDRAIHNGTHEAFEAFVAGCEAGCERHGSRVHSHGLLLRLGTWLSEPWRTACASAIERDASNERRLSPITAARLQVPAYQRYRPRAAALSTLATRVFAALRRHEGALRAFSADQLEVVVRNTITREACLSWKVRMEREHPSVLMESDELTAKARALEAADHTMRHLNRRVLTESVDVSRLGTRNEWEDITRLTGARAFRLREFVDRGRSIGLLHLRPIWLVNPDVASRLLPLKGSLFDTVIYDEASQMPVEFALPSLFRARSFVVSGDEKQMPPTAFFSSRIENDEADVPDEDDAGDGASQELLDERTDSWNRREIKDCPDLLQLAKSTVPSEILQVHYRSRYRELIAFSNAAFYDGRLHVPCRHPDVEVHRAKPVELVRVDGVYVNQTNEREAEEVVSQLVRLWAGPAAGRKTVGVVTFNRKQADLIEAALEERAQLDAYFREAFTQERERTEDGEDMSFFVKNVENVQGDERDIIIFSSTFGRNAQGTFRRSFGVLGQSGGERRLNVAISRAREKVILVTSMPIPEISDLLSTRRPAASPRDFLQAYFEYARSMTAGEFDGARALLGRLSAQPRSLRSRQRESDDGIKVAVANFIEQELQFTVEKFTEADAFAIDFAITDKRTGSFGIGIDVDAPQDPLLASARARELWRPQVLKRAVPVLHRVSSHGWYHDPDVEQQRLRDAVRVALGTE